MKMSLASICVWLIRNNSKLMLHLPFRLKVAYSCLKLHLFKFRTHILKVCIQLNSQNTKKLASSSSAKTALFLRHSLPYNVLPDLSTLSWIRSSTFHFFGFRNSIFFNGARSSALHPTPNLWRSRSLVFMSPSDRVGEVYHGYPSKARRTMVGVF
jgi:hypothetical protein